MSESRPRVRRVLYPAVAVVALLLALTPCVLAPDMVVPRKPPTVPYLERLVFSWLAYPPTYARERLGIEGGYVGFFAPDRFPSGLPSFAQLAAGHLAVAVPFWFGVASGLFEFAMLAIRRSRGGKKVD